MQCKESHYFTDTDVSRYPANVDVGHILLLDDVLQAGLRQLLVVKEGGVGVDVRVGALEWNLLTHRKCLSTVCGAQGGKGGQVGGDVTSG